MKETLVPMVSISLDELDLFRWNFFTSIFAMTRLKRRLKRRKMLKGNATPPVLSLAPGDFGSGLRLEK